MHDHVNWLPDIGACLDHSPAGIRRADDTRASVEGLVVGSTEFDPVHRDYNWVEPGVPEGDGLAVFIAYDPGWWGVAKLDSFGALMSLPPLLN